MSDYTAEATQAADRIMAILTAHPLTAQHPYELSEVLTVLTEQHELLQRLVTERPTPTAVDAQGNADKFGEDLAALMSYLQLMRTLYHALTDVPDHLRTQANRTLSITHLAARKLRDRGHRIMAARS